MPFFVLLFICFLVFMKKYLSFLKEFYSLNNPLSSSGRIGRLSYLFWTFCIPLLIILPLVLFVGWLTVFVGITWLVSIFSWIWALSAFCLALIASGKRLHDFNFSAGWMLVFLIPGLNIILLIAMLCIPWTSWKNQYWSPYKTPKWERIGGILSLCFVVIWICLQAFLMLMVLGK